MAWHLARFHRTWKLPENYKKIVQLQFALSLRERAKKPKARENPATKKFGGMKSHSSEPAQLVYRWTFEQI